MFTAFEPLLWSVLFGAGAAAALVPLCKLLAVRAGCVAKPKEDRWHRRPTPLFGGVAIAVPTLAAGAWLGVGHPDLLVLLLCGALIFVVGLVDDIISIRPATKLIAEIGVASILLFFQFRLGWTESMILDALLTLLWIVGITNALNLLDNMDGLCAGTAIIAIVALLIGSVAQTGVTPVSVFAAAMAGATAGFLIFNFNPASIFMGDSGSLFLGLNISALTLLSSNAHPGSSLLPVIIGPAMLLLIPIFDTTLVTALRMLAGRRASQGGRDHSSHRLVAIGLSERAAVAVLWTLAALGGLIALGVRHMDQGWGTVAAAAFLLAMIIFAVYLSKVKVYDPERMGVIRANITPLVNEFMYKRRVSEVLLDVCLVTIAYYCAYRLRFEGTDYFANYPYFIQSLPIVLGSQMTALFVIGAYRGVWRHFSLMDAVVLGKGAALGAVGAQLIVLYLFRFAHYSRAVFVIYAVLLVLLLATSRASFRLVGEFIQRRHATGRRCLIYGAGDAAALAVRELRAQHEPFRIVGFIDDDAAKVRVRVVGYPVLGTYEALETLVTTGAVDVVVISARRLELVRLRELERLCTAHDVVLLRLQVDLERLVHAS
jgi:UDP-GlcNAc:undecaprenyl-phosphate/decaprenyl-phosphate GlcNAc-1-phosphate transferase